MKINYSHDKLFAYMIGMIVDTKIETSSNSTTTSTIKKRQKRIVLVNCIHIIYAAACYDGYYSSRCCDSTHCYMPRLYLPSFCFFGPNREKKNEPTTIFENVILILILFLYIQRKK